MFRFRRAADGKIRAAILFAFARKRSTPLPRAGADSERDSSYHELRAIGERAERATSANWLATKRASAFLFLSITSANYQQHFLSPNELPTRVGEGKQ